MIQATARARSFTLIEMLVVMILTSIIVAILYVAYISVTGYQINLTNRQEAIGNLNALYVTMVTDVNNCKLINYTGQSGFVCTMGNGVLIEYDVYPFGVTRRQGERVDSIRFNIDNPVFLFRNKPVNAGSIIDEIRITLRDGTTETFDLVVAKQYDASMLIGVNSQEGVN